MIKNIVVSLLITAIVAALSGALGLLLFETSFLKVFSVVFLIQIIIAYFWNSLTQTLRMNKAETEETKRIELYAQQGVDAECAYCKVTNFIPLRMDEDNDFDCVSCSKTNSVYIDVTVAQKTQIIDKESLSVTGYITKNIDKNG